MPVLRRATGVTRELLTGFGDDLRYVFRHLPLTEIHSHAALAARAAEAASHQDPFWSMHDLLLAHHGELTLEVVASLAADLDLDVAAFLDDLDSPGVEERVARDIASAEASGARGTPTFFVNGQRVIGAHGTQTMAALLSSHGPPAEGTSPARCSRLADAPEPPHRRVSKHPDRLVKAARSVGATTRN